MSMNTEGEYRIDRGEMIHRAASLATTAALMAIVWYHAGWAEAIRMGGRCFLAVACIWFADAFGSAGMAGRWQAGSRGPAIVSGVFRWAGWFMLVAWFVFAWLVWIADPA